MGRELLTELSEGILLMACGPKVPGEPDFDRFLRMAETGSYRALWVHTAGGYFDAVQRKRAASVIRAADSIAIMADSMVARGAVTAFSWLVRGVRGFGGTAFEEARLHLDASEASQTRLIRLIASLKGD